MTRIAISLTAGLAFFAATETVAAGNIRDYVRNFAYEPTEAQATYKIVILYDNSRYRFSATDQQLVGIAIRDDVKISFEAADANGIFAGITIVEVKE